MTDDQKDHSNQAPHGGDNLHDQARKIGTDGGDYTEGNQIKAGSAGIAAGRDVRVRIDSSQGVVAIVAIVALIVLVVLFFNDSRDGSIGTQIPTPRETGVTAPTENLTDTPTPSKSPTPNVTLTPIPVRVKPDWTPVTAEIGGIPMVYVPAGCFVMGSTAEQVQAAIGMCEADGSPRCELYADEQPQHEVCLTAFWIGKTEVTNDQYRICVRAGGCPPPSLPAAPPPEQGQYENPDYGYYPVVDVNRVKAEAYARWLCAGKLPTEAQWEYAARGPESRVYPWGDDFDGTRLNFCDTMCYMKNWASASWFDGYRLIAPVGTYPDGASWVGALDMAGNVLEWTADTYHKDYYATLEDGVLDPIAADPADDAKGVLRGGSWYFAAHRARSAFRIDFDPAAPSNGFRVVCMGATPGTGEQ